jgi:hypothetical protein
MTQDNDDDHHDNNLIKSRHSSNKTLIKSCIANIFHDIDYYVPKDLSFINRLYLQ